MAKYCITVWIYYTHTYWTSLVAQTIKNLPAMQEMRVQSLDREDPLKKGIATLSSLLAWRIAWTEEPGRLQSMGSQLSSNTSEQLRLSLPWIYYTFTHSLTDEFIFLFWKCEYFLWIMLLWTFMYKFLCGHIFSFFFDIHLGVKWLAYMATLF